MAHTSRLLTSLACRCASTSTSLPCTHASPLLRRAIGSQSAPSQQQLEARAASSGPAFEYTAPLWEKAAFQRSNAWSGWYAASRAAVPPSAALSATPSQASAPPSKKQRDLARGEELLGSYIALGSGRQEFLRGLKKVPGGFIALLGAAEQRALPVVLAQLKKDLSVLRASAREEAQEQVEREDDAARWKKELRRFLDGATSDASLARRLAEIDPDSTPFEGAEDSSAGRSAAVKLLWERFSVTAKFDQATDLLPALAFLHHLAKPPSATSSSPPDLALALKVLQKLIATGAVDSAQVAPAPTFETVDGEALPKEVTLQFILLRTVVSLANASEDSTLALATLQSINSVRDKYAASNAEVKESAVEEDTVDVELLEESAHALLNELELERATVYSPKLARLSTQLATKSEVLSAQTLIAEILPRWVGGVVAEETNEVLQSFAVQLAARERFDLLAKLWLAWREQGWQLASSQLKLLRWLGGSAPFRTYAALIEGAPISLELPRPPSTRVIHADQLELFATSFDPTAVRDTWTSEEKNDWLCLLCNLRGASERTRRAARKAFTIWSAGELVLSGRTTLTLVRSSLSLNSVLPEKARQMKSAFALRIVNHFIRQLTSSDSPFASIENKRIVIPHSDLTSLASCYALMGDYTSIKQVYKRLLDQKMVPDRKDIRTLLACAVVRHPRVGTNLGQLALSLGVQLDEEDFILVIRHVKRMVREWGETDNRTARRVVGIASEWGALGPRAVERLARTADPQGYANKDKSASARKTDILHRGIFAEPSVEALRGELKAYRHRFEKPRETRLRGWRDALMVYQTAREAGVQDSTSLSHLIEGFLRDDQSLPNSERRDQLRDALRELVAQHLQQASQASKAALSDRLAESSLGAGLRLADVQLLKRAGQIYGPAGLVAEESVQKVCRWAKQNRARLDALTEGSWWGGLAEFEVKQKRQKKKASA